MRDGLTRRTSSPNEMGQLGGLCSDATLCPILSAEAHRRSGQNSNCTDSYDRLSVLNNDLSQFFNPPPML